MNRPEEKYRSVFRSDVGARRLNQVVEIFRSGAGNNLSVPQAPIGNLDVQSLILLRNLIAFDEIHCHLLQARKSSGLSVKNFALRTGLSTCEISLFERRPLQSSLETVLIYSMSVGWQAR